MSSVSARDIAWCGAATDKWRHGWARAGRLKQHGPFSEHDAVLTAVASQVAVGVSRKLAPAVWDTVQSSVQEILLQGDGEFWIVVPCEGPRHRAMSSSDDAAHYAATVGPCWVIDASDAAAEAKRRFAEVAGTSDAAGTVHQIRPAVDL